MNLVIPSEKGGVKEWYSLPLNMNLKNPGTGEFPVPRDTNTSQFESRSQDWEGNDLRKKECEKK